MRSHPIRGVARTEVVATLAAIVVLPALLLPALNGVRAASMQSTSLTNLRILAQVQDCYANDWGDRQFTAVPDDLSMFGNNVIQACGNYTGVNGMEPPPLYAGFGPQGSMWGFFNCQGYGISLPFAFDGQFAGVGSFRMQNVLGLHEYLSDRYFDPTYYAPEDEIAYDAASPFFDSDVEYPGMGLIVPPTYAFSPAAMFDPGVFRKQSEGGYQDPFSFDDGMRSPGVTEVRFAGLKTRMIEHHWLRNSPEPCNPAYEGLFEDLYSPECSPYLFNHGADAAPAALFFDGSVERLRTGDVAEDDEALLKRSGDGLWSRDTPLGASGYFGDASWDGTNVSHHILTTDGIRGRDRL